MSKVELLQKKQQRQSPLPPLLNQAENSLFNNKKPTSLHKSQHGVNDSALLCIDTLWVHKVIITNARIKGYMTTAKGTEKHCILVPVLPCSNEKYVTRNILIRKIMWEISCVWNILPSVDERLARYFSLDALYGEHVKSRWRWKNGFVMRETFYKDPVQRDTKRLNYTTHFVDFVRSYLYYSLCAL